MVANSSADPYGVLTADDFTGFQVQRQRVNDSYNIGTTQNAFQRGSLKLNYDQSVGDMKRAYSQQLARLPSSYSKRNLLHSGLYAKAVKDFNEGWDAQKTNASAQYQNQMSGLQIADNQLTQIRNSSNSEIDFRDAARRATAYSLKMNGTGVWQGN